MFQKLENNRPFLKMALEGFAGDGKTRTAAEIAIGIHKLVKSNKPIAIFDTERAAKALLPLFEQNGIEAVSSEARSLASLSEAIKWCESGGSDILIIDSITHVWENYLDAYKKEKNRYALQFQDWGIIKPKWKNEFSTPFVNANVHIIFTGRAGYEYEEEKVEQENGRMKREIFKSGIKMKAETETAFEPDLLVLMEKVQDILGDKKTIYRTAMILKDRTSMIDGIVLNVDGRLKGPSFEMFYPAIKQLLSGTVKQHTGGELPDTFKDFEEKFSNIGRNKDIAISEIEGHFNLMELGTSKEHKGLKSSILKAICGQTSLEGVKDLRLESIQECRDVISEFSVKYIEYMKECLQIELQPDMNKIKEYLTETILDIRSNGLSALDK